MTTLELMLKVKDILQTNGFETESVKYSNLPEYGARGYAWKDGKAYRTPVPGYTFTNKQGYEIDFNVVYRSNGTEQNVSVSIQLVEWHDSIGHTLAKEKVNVKMGDKAINNRVNKIIALYEEI